MDEASKYDESFDEFWDYITDVGWMSSEDLASEAFKAGAEYMRQECIKKVYGMCESDNVAARTVEAIRKIEA